MKKLNALVGLNIVLLVIMLISCSKIVERPVDFVIKVYTFVESLITSIS